jgi:hypothetical protein
MKLFNREWSSLFFGATEIKKKSHDWGNQNWVEKANETHTIAADPCTMSKKQPERAKAHKNVYDIEAQQKHLRRHLESLERDNHQPLDDVEGLVSVALAHIEDDSSGSIMTTLCLLHLFFFTILSNGYVTRKI